MSNFFTEFDPESWVISAWQGLEAYVKDNLDTDIYEIVMSFPSANKLGELMPLGKTVIHFEWDMTTNKYVGFGHVGEGIVDQNTGQITFYEAHQRDINVDVGIWASVRSGGVSARLKAYQVLVDMFTGAQAFDNIKIRNMELRSFDGFSCIRDEVENLEVFRAIDMTLMLRVFSKKAQTDQPIEIDSFDQDPELTISDQLIIGE